MEKDSFVDNEVETHEELISNELFVELVDESNEGQQMEMSVEVSREGGVIPEVSLMWLSSALKGFFPSFGRRLKNCNLASAELKSFFLMLQGDDSPLLFWSIFCWKRRES